MSDKVLVIEDEPLVRELVTLNLKHAGYEVDSAGDFRHRAGQAGRPGGPTWRWST